MSADKENAAVEASCMTRLSMTPRPGLRRKCGT